MIKVKSKTDVITNSSTEVFIFKMDKDYFDMKAWIKEQGQELDLWEVNTLDDLKETITDRDYKGWAWNDWWSTGNTDKIPLPDEDPWEEKGNFLYDYPGQTIDEIWEKTKHHYKDLVGYAFGSHDTECGGRSLIDDWKEMKHKERMQSLVESLPNDGSMVTVFFDKSMERLTKSYKGIRFVLMLSKDRQKISTYHPSYDGGFQLDRAIDGPLTIMDKDDIRPATPEEVKKFMDEIATNEIWELDTENHIIKKRNEDQK